MEDLLPRKPVTAWEAETAYDEDGPFVILTLHHGLGEMTRVDLSADDADEVAFLLGHAAKDARTA